MRDEQSEFAAKGVTTLGVNHAPVESHERYADRFEFPFPLLSDPDRAVARAYHALKENGRGIHRTVYLVGTDRRIRFGQRGAPATDSILASLE